MTIVMIPSVDNVFERIAFDEEQFPARWRVTHDARGYTCERFGLEKKAWDRWVAMMVRQAPSIPPAEFGVGLTVPDPMETFTDIESARQNFATDYDQMLQWASYEFFRQIDPARYSANEDE